MFRSLKPGFAMILTLIVAACVLGQAQEPRDVTGTWTAELHNGKVFLQVRTSAPTTWNSWSGDWNMGQTFPIEEFSGLPPNDEHFTASTLKFELHREAGNLAFEGAGSRTPMAADTICRLGSMTKPIVAACAMTLVEDCTLRLDDPVDALIPELADMTVLADPNGRLDDTVPAKRPITLRDLLTYTLGTGMTVGAASGTAPISR